MRPQLLHGAAAQQRRNLVLLLLVVLALLAAALVSSFQLGSPRPEPGRIRPVTRRWRPTTTSPRMQSSLFPNPQDGGDASSRPPPPEAPWFVEGARFECTGCGKCCRVKGDVWLSPSEVDVAAQHLGLTPDEMAETYGQEYHMSGWLRLKSRPFPEGGESCVFLNDANQCSIYEARPLQCRTYPWWPRVMYSRESWLNESVVPDDIPLGPHWNDMDGGCEGIEHPEAPLVDFNTIRTNLLTQIGYNRALPSHIAP